MVHAPIPLDVWLDDFDTHTQLTIPDMIVKLSPDVDGIALTLARLRQLKKLLALTEMFVEDELVKVMPGKQYDVSGLGVIEMHTGASRKAWKKEELIDAIVHSIAAEMPTLADPSSGELVNLIDHVRHLVEMLTDAATPSWKVTGLRKFGIDPDEYCETSWGRKTVQTPELPESTAATE